MKRFKDVIDAFPSAEALARDIGEKGVTVRQWRNRDSIPSRYWGRIADVAKSSHIAGVTVGALARIAAGGDEAFDTDRAARGLDPDDLGSEAMTEADTDLRVSKSGAGMDSAATDEDAQKGDPVPERKKFSRGAA